ncbi:hypothetical protein NM688_g835 [Phlebia brevispora]|uniref:Uncharacterized protein n=1 Tax=Phlebia brevispora TaxID=194682 RepID=A0ACC1TDG3_9APHY|nr:hypothetical protein NM688_g835 [Phlebia brevispora]
MRLSSVTGLTCLRNQKSQCVTIGGLELTKPSTSFAQDRLATEPHLILRSNLPVALCTPRGLHRIPHLYLSSDDKKKALIEAAHIPVVTYNKAFMPTDHQRLFDWPFEKSRTRGCREPSPIRYHHELKPIIATDDAFGSWQPHSFPGVFRSGAKPCHRSAVRGVFPDCAPSIADAALLFQISRDLMEQPRRWGHCTMPEEGTSYMR